MAATNAELELRIRALEKRLGRHQDFRPSLGEGRGEMLMSLRRIEQRMAALLAHHGVGDGEGTLKVEGKEF